MDHSAATYAVADALAARYAHLVLLTPRTQIARNVNYCSAIGVHRRLYEADAEIIVAAEPVSLHDGVLDLAQRVHRNARGRSRTSRCSSGRRRASPTTRWRGPLRQAGIDTRLVGRLHGAAQSSLRDPRRRSRRDGVIRSR